MDILDESGKTLEKRRHLRYGLKGREAGTKDFLDHGVVEG